MFLNCLFYIYSYNVKLFNEVHKYLYAFNGCFVTRILDKIILKLLQCLEHYKFTNEINKLSTISVYLPIDFIIKLLLSNKHMLRLIGTDTALHFNVVNW